MVSCSDDHLLSPVSLSSSTQAPSLGLEPEGHIPCRVPMNTRGALARVFSKHGFRESEFAYLDDCRTFTAFRTLLILELCLWRGLHFLGLRYPENCLLGVYQRV